MHKEEQQQVFADWLRDHQKLFFKVVRAYAFTPQDQEDLFQEIATQVWRSIPGFRGLRGILARRSHSRNRRRAHGLRRWMDLSRGV